MVLKKITPFVDYNYIYVWNLQDCNQQIKENKVFKPINKDIVVIKLWVPV